MVLFVCLWVTATLISWLMVFDLSFFSILTDVCILSEGFYLKRAAWGSTGLIPGPPLTDLQTGMFEPAVGRWTSQRGRLSGQD